MAVKKKAVKKTSKKTSKKIVVAGSVKMQVRLKIRNRKDKSVTLYKVEKTGINKATSDAFIKSVVSGLPKKPVRGGNKVQLIVKVNKKPIENLRSQVGPEEAVTLKSKLFA